MHLVVVSRIYLPEPSAASFFLSAVADELCSRNHEVTVLTAAPPRGYAMPERAERIRTFPVLRDRTGYVRGYLQYMSFDIPVFFRLLFTQRPSAVLVEPPPTTGVMVRLACWLRRIPYVYDAADLWSFAAGHATSSSLVLRTLEELERRALSGAQRIVTVSDEVKDRIIAWGVTTPITTTGRGADTSQFHYSPAPSKPLFLYAGSYSAWHGAIVLADAFAEFLTTHPGFTLRFVGHGSELESIRERADQLGIADAVEFADPVPPSELNAQLSAATASLATLLPGGGYEFAFATKTYSSLASGCPVIFAGPGPTAAFLARANTEVHAGAPVAYDPAAIAAAMREIADAPAPPASRERLAVWADEHVSMRAAAARAADAILDVANGATA
ncbi:glycosyltransferase [Salinibacterium sp. NG253]|uniref:glycosyltransferase n=1 Tax=Salinibacterium sp. NG253 TaxID=2792039 RepID=UPI0018CD2FFE|nr:glycosyltransferase [Salinibacterium sp. NG253]MBH0116123.1 glycosyltransferase [Salinibacterium sp. NG253]